MNAASLLRTLADRITAVSNAEADYRKTLSELNGIRVEVERRERFEVVRLTFARYCMELFAVNRAIEEYAVAARAQVIEDFQEFNRISELFKDQQPSEPTPSVYQN